MVCFLCDSLAQTDVFSLFQAKFCPTTQSSYTPPSHHPTSSQGNSRPIGTTSDELHSPSCSERRTSQTSQTRTKWTKMRALAPQLLATTTPFSLKWERWSVT